MGLADKSKNILLNIMTAMNFILVILLIVACCGMSDLANTLRGASWATSYEEEERAWVFISFYGACWSPTTFFFNATNDQGTNGMYCSSWDEVTQCNPDVAGTPDTPDAFWTTACRTKNLKGWLAFCMIISFFLTLAFTIAVLFRRLTDSPKRKIGALVTGCLAWIFLLLTFSTFSANCLPRGDEATVIVDDEFVKLPVYMVPGPGMGSTVTAWFFIFLFVPINAFLSSGATTRAKYEPKETPAIVVTGMP